MKTGSPPSGAVILCSGWDNPPELRRSGSENPTVLVRSYAAAQRFAWTRILIQAVSDIAQIIILQPEMVVARPSSPKVRNFLILLIVIRYIIKKKFLSIGVNPNSSVGRNDGINIK